MNRPETIHADTTPRRFAGWRVAGLASFIHNCSYGMSFGVYGISVLAIQERFGTSRAIAALALSLITASVVISAPILGALYGRISIRRSIMLGSLLGAAGHLCLAGTHDWRLMLAAYAFLVGPGVALSGSMPTNVLATKWFIARQGTALGIVNLPLGLMLVPLAAVEVLQREGLTTLYALTGVAFLLILPAAWALVDSPEQIGQSPLRSPTAAIDERGAIGGPTLTMPAILSRLDFWVLVFAIGIIVGGSSMKYAHMVPLLGEQGHSIELASRLLALAGGAGAIGALMVGWIADRIGGARVLIGTAILQAMMWFVFLLPISIPLLTVDAVIIGMCGGGIAIAQGVFISQRFGVNNFSRVLGLLALALLPFFVGINPLAGYLRDATGDYRYVVSLLILASVFVAGLLGMVIRDHRAARAVASS